MADRDLQYSMFARGSSRTAGRGRTSRARARNRRRVERRDEPF